MPDADKDAAFEKALAETRAEYREALDRLADEGLAAEKGTPNPSDREWRAWATLANNVSEALGALPERPRFSERNAVADALWRLGYRPTEEQIESEIARQRDYVLPPAEGRTGESR